ncbi:MAG: hypothetical protein WCR95_08440 [Eubacteriales bacterium]
MPLIIAVVAIVVFFVVIHDKQKDYNRESANREKMMRKTNSYLERETLDKFLREGMTFDEAYNATVSEMVKLGFDPCIPREAYGKKYCGVNEPINGETSWVDNPGKYDSDTVKRRRNEEQGNGYHGKPTNPSGVYGYNTMELDLLQRHCNSIPDTGSICRHNLKRKHIKLSP